MHNSSFHRRQRQSGFTLLEIVAAFAILALGLGMAMRAATGAMQQSRQAAEQTVAALHAQSVMETLGVAEPLEEGEYSGEFEDGYRWRASVLPYEVLPQDDELEFDLTLAPVELKQIELFIEWERGEQVAEARFTTLRAMLPRP